MADCRRVRASAVHGVAQSVDFSPPIRVPIDGTSGEEIEASLTEDGLVLYWLDLATIEHDPHILATVPVDMSSE